MSVAENIFAFTEPGSEYPGYVSINRLENGDVSVSVRAKPKRGNGSRVCHSERDAGPYDCYPGSPHCNNYCNLAPQKGPMQDHPERVDWVKEGALVELIVPSAQWPEELPK